MGLNQKSIQSDKIKLILLSKLGFYCKNKILGEKVHNEITCKKILDNGVI